MLSQFYCGYNQIITYLRVKETKTYVVFSKTTDNCLIITYLRVKETKT